MSKLTNCFGLGLLAAIVGLGPVGASEPYPTKPVRFVVPFAAGGATDLLARTIGEKLSSRLRQPFVG
jgi:tripartite-type tricarboxylate transporter receptor subunit TctC